MGAISATRRGAGLGALWLLVPSLALAGPRTVTIAAGDCRNPELITATQTFSMEVGSKVGADMLTSEAVLERFRPVPTVSSDELGRQLEAAQNQFYAGAYEQALESLRSSTAAIERLSPRAEPWKLMSRGLVLQSLVLRSTGKKQEALDAQRRVLRVDPGFKLDVDYYSPATIQAFEAVRKEMQKVKKVRLTITSSPNAAQVFLDGAPVGKTPFAGEFPPGDYRLSLASAEKVSYTRELKLSRDEALQIDVGFEGALSPLAPLCLTAEPAQAVDLALKLAALAGADAVVVLGLESRNNEPGWVNAVLLEVNKGTKVRDGGIRFMGARRAQSLTALAGFVLTGNPSAAEVAALAAPAEAIASPPATTIERRAGRGLAPRILSVALIGAGAIVAISAGAVYASGGADRAALAPLINENGIVRNPANAEEAKGLGARIDANARTTVALAATGGAAVLAGAAVFFLFPPDEGGAQLSLAPTPEGFWAGASFRF